VTLRILLAAAAGTVVGPFVGFAVYLTIMENLQWL
jgi:hypothetical protein